MKTGFILLIVSAFLLAATAGVQGQVTASTYQGQLSEDGSPANGVYDFEFYLFDVDGGGIAIAGPESASGVTVSNGLFTTTVDFGSGPFDGTQLWLEVGVRTNGGGGFTALAPRTEVTSTPYSVFAGTVAAVLNDSVGSAQVIDNSLTASDLAADSVGASEIATGAVASSEIADGTVTSADIADGTLLGVDLAKNTVGSAQLADSIALGSASAAGQLDVFSAVSGGPAVSLFGTSVGANQGGEIRVRNSSGSSRIILYGEDSNGDGNVVCDVMEIRGGSDLSEQFDVNSTKEAVQPGAVVCIDPENPGKLKLSNKAYDRTVAGVVSGAGGVKTGMMMGQNGTVADGQHPVALTGRVYCLVDADQGAIEPGDLITTSSTPGHGMKVADYARAQGAILGKAMTSLAKGKGLVMVLVSLQ